MFDLEDIQNYNEYWYKFPRLRTRKKEREVKLRKESQTLNIEVTQVPKMRVRFDDSLTGILR